MKGCRFYATPMPTKSLLPNKDFEELRSRFGDVWIRRPLQSEAIKRSNTIVEEVHTKDPAVTEYELACPLPKPRSTQFKPTNSSTDLEDAVWNRIKVYKNEGMTKKLIQERLEQLKRFHTTALNWSTIPISEQEEFLDHFEELCLNGYHRLTKAEKEKVSLADIHYKSVKANFEEWDLVLQKNYDNQQNDWKKMSLEDKKAAFYLAFGPKGRDKVADKRFAIKYVGIRCVLIFIAGYIGLEGINWLSGYEKPRTMTREWQEASNAIAKEAGLNKYDGISSEGYKGRGHISVK